MERREFTNGGFDDRQECQQNGVGAGSGGDLYGANNGHHNDDDSDAENSNETQLLLSGNFHGVEKFEREGHDC